MGLKWVKWLGIPVCCLMVAGCAHFKHEAGQAFKVADHGSAKAQIVVAENASPSTRYAAEELQRFLKEITGAELAVVSDAVPVKPGEIIVGANKHFDKVTKGSIKIADLGREGYIIRTIGQSYLVIAGGEPRGNLYGVYGLLEDHLGCRWFTPAVNRIPKQETLVINALNEQIIPKLEYREPFVKDCQEGDWAARNRMNSSAANLEARHGGKVTYFGFVHTSDQLLPPDKYFDQHPEYFSLVKGKRLKERTQLCSTNPEVVRLVTEAVLKRMGEHPECTVFSVSQNDWLNFCECDKCAALAKAEGTQMAPLLSLVNQVAVAAAKAFPDKLIDTLAYQYTRKAPKTMRPEPNVIIRLCSIECCFAHPFETCDSPENRDFVKDVEDWGKKSNRLWVWNYDTSFSEYLTPYPNLRVRKPNIQFYERNHVTGIFEQDVYTTLNGELSSLSGYLNAKLLWNADYDSDKAINEFLEGVYGAASGPIRRYIDLLHDKVAKENLHMDIWIDPSHPLLNGVVEQADALWDEAEAAVAQNPEVLERVRVARLSMDYAYIERMRMEGLKIYAIDHAKGTVTLNPKFAARLKRFVEVADRNNVTTLREAASGDFKLYKKELEGLQNITTGKAKAAQKVKGLKPGLSYKAYEGAWDVLPDFSKLKPIGKGVAETISLKVEPPKETFGLDFNGYFLAPADGVYLFHCLSNDGSKMFLDGDEVINNDGLHKMMRRSSAVMLKKGYHRIRVEYFQAGGKKGLEMRYEGPGIDNTIVPVGALWHAEGK